MKESNNAFQFFIQIEHQIENKKNKIIKPILKYQ